MPPFDATTGHLPPGRFRVTFDEAKRALVSDPLFSGSTSRARLWDGLERYLVRFAALEDLYASRLTDDPLLHYLWLGGSFASAEVSPRNIDVTVCVDAENRSRLRGVPGGGWMNDAFRRQAILTKYELSPLEMKYRAVPSVFQLDRLGGDDLTYLRSRGGWDDWWQRCRTPGEGSPSVASAAARRGYLAVTL